MLNQDLIRFKSAKDNEYDIQVRLNCFDRSVRYRTLEREKRIFRFDFHESCSRAEI